ncbi:hypothetical protein JMJ35_007035 [Cladonia borealis]|uniref:catalase n=1 Tax=Cladonia borealis TaxID=184061 RepID=A0AA39QWQ7_9LECA|nr:hypothetical protein JMJ35_007035 [Cladonia borealis]
MSYNNTANHRHNSPQGYLLPINKAVVPVNNNYRDDYMQPLLFEGASTSSPDDIGGVIGASLNNSTNGTLSYTCIPPEFVNGAIGRYPNLHSSFGQERTFWSTLAKYAQQHTVDAYCFELGRVSDPAVQQRYIDSILNNVDNCLVRRVAMGIGATLPAVGNGPSRSTNASATVPYFYRLTSSLEPNESNAGLIIGILADDASYEVVSTHIGPLATGVYSNQSSITTSNIFSDAIIVGGVVPDASNSSVNASSIPLALFEVEQFVQEACGHGKAIAALGTSVQTLQAVGINFNAGLRSS